MKTIIHNIDNAETVYASLQIKQKEVKMLRDYMHTPEGEDIKFPYGVHLVYRGRGWYRLIPTLQHRALENFKFAMLTIRRFNKWHEDYIAAECKKLILEMQANVAPVAFVAPEASNYASGVYTFAGAQSSTQRPPQPEATKQFTHQGVVGLKKFAARFGHTLKVS